MANKKSNLNLFEKIWYVICALVVLWGLTYIVLGVISRFNDIAPLDDFATGFERMFKLNLQFWGAIIIAIGAVAAVVVMLFYAKTYDRASDREQRRSARLNALKKEEKVVSEQRAEVVNEAPAEAPEQ